VVLLAGKGHEDYQEVAGVKRPFLDSAEGAQACWRRGARRAARHDDAGPGPVRCCRAALLVGDATPMLSRACTATRARCSRATCSWPCAASASTRHDFLPQARAAGAAAALAERGLAEAGLPGLQVADSWPRCSNWPPPGAALHLPLIAVAGSNGKTTVTQMIAAILRAWLATRAWPPPAT
jgi:murE/murF fusion protein